MTLDFSVLSGISDTRKYLLKKQAKYAFHLVEFAHRERQQQENNSQ